MALALIDSGRSGRKDLMAYQNRPRESGPRLRETPYRGWGISYRTKHKKRVIRLQVSSVIFQFFNEPDRGHY